MVNYKELQPSNPTVMEKGETRQLFKQEDKPVHFRTIFPERYSYKHPPNRCMGFSKRNGAPNSEEEHLNVALFLQDAFVHLFHDCIRC